MTHLTEETIAELVEGRLEGARFERAESHVASCTRCMRLVEAAGSALATTSGVPSSLRVPAVLAPGARVSRYEILAPIGAGGMGRVYAAHDPVLDRRVALKLLHPGAATRDREARLLREAKTMARLSHPEVIAVYDAGRFADQLFIAMELVEGTTLREWLARGPRPWREVLAAFLRAGRGLAYAHGAGIVHRDFKPDNVLVGDDGRVRVTDFGLARTVEGEPAAPPASGPSSGPASTLTRTGALLGTPSYMAPEQHAGATADERTDVYAFCVALYEGLYGVRPFHQATHRALAEAKIAGKIAAPGTDRGVPARLRRVILVGLRPLPGERYASMTELLSALERAARIPRGPVAAAVALAMVAAGVIGVARAHRGTPATTPGAMAVAECHDHAACAAKHGGEPFACRAADGVCVPMATEHCAPMFEAGDTAAPDTVWLGAMFPAKATEDAGPGAPAMAAVNRARSELASERSRSSPRARPVALVTCDDRTDAAAAARHLVDVVGVPAILGFGREGEQADLAGALLAPRGVVSLDTMTDGAAFSSIAQPPSAPRQAWRTGHGPESAADAAAFFVRGPIAARAGGPPRRVVLVRDDAAEALLFAPRLFHRLTRRAGMPLKDAADFKEVVLPQTPRAEDLERAADAVVADQAQVVVLLGAGDRARTVAEAVERQVHGGPPPIYLLVDGSTAPFASFVGPSPDRRRRVLAVSAGSRPAAQASAYDAFYLLAYAALSSRADAPVDGPSLAAALARMIPPALTVRAGADDVGAALAAIATGEAIDVTGASDPLDLDPGTGEWGPDFRLLCPAVDARGRASGEDADSGVRYVPRTHKVTGTLACP